MEQILLAIGASAATTALVVALLRYAGPLVSKLFGTVLKTRAELDADRDRIITNLRSELDDMNRRLNDCNTGWNLARAESATAKARTVQLEGFIDRFLARYGLDRSAIEQGEPWPSEINRGRRSSGGN